MDADRSGTVVVAAFHDVVAREARHRSGRRQPRIEIQHLAELDFRRRRRVVRRRRRFGRQRLPIGRERGNGNERQRAQRACQAQRLESEFHRRSPGEWPCHAPILDRRTRGRLTQVKATRRQSGVAVAGTRRPGRRTRLRRRGQQRSGSCAPPFSKSRASFVGDRRTTPLDRPCDGLHHCLSAVTALPSFVRSGKSERIVPEKFARAS